METQNESNWSTRVRGEFASTTTLGDVDFTSLATRWGVSVRSLRRYLESEQASLSALLDEERFARARTWLAEPSLTLQQIAARLGYREVNSFQRAFKRWAGMPPGTYRRRAHDWPEVESMPPAIEAE